MINIIIGAFLFFVYLFFVLYGFFAVIKDIRRHKEAKKRIDSDVNDEQLVDK